MGKKSLYCILQKKKLTTSLLARSCNYFSLFKRRGVQSITKKHDDSKISPVTNRKSPGYLLNSPTLLYSTNQNFKRSEKKTHKMNAKGKRVATHTHSLSPPHIPFSSLLSAISSTPLRCRGCPLRHDALTTLVGSSRRCSAGRCR